MYIRNYMPQFRRLDLKQLSITNDNGRIEILAVEVALEIRKNGYLGFSLSVLITL